MTEPNEETTSDGQSQAETPARPEQASLDPVVENDHAEVKVPPPLIFLLLILLGWLAHRVWPLPMGIPDGFSVLGYALTLFGVALVILMAGNFKRNSTAIEPWKPTTALITTGLYAWSRNPIYVGLCLFNMGIGIASNNLWIFLSFIPGAVLVYYFAIAKEEAYLERRFGGEYLVYKGRVRRWL